MMRLSKLGSYSCICRHVYRLFITLLTKSRVHLRVGFNGFRIDLGFRVVRVEGFESVCVRPRDR